MLNPFRVQGPTRRDVIRLLALSLAGQAAAAIRSAPPMTPMSERSMCPCSARSRFDATSNSN